MKITCANNKTLKFFLLFGLSFGAYFIGFYTKSAIADELQSYTLRFPFTRTPSVIGHTRVISLSATGNLILHEQIAFGNVPPRTFIYDRTRDVTIESGQGAFIGDKRVNLLGSFGKCQASGLKQATLSKSGQFLFFELLGSDCPRGIQRLDLSTGELYCVGCHFDLEQYSKNSYEVSDDGSLIMFQFDNSLAYYDLLENLVVGIVDTERDFDGELVQFAFSSSGNRAAFSVAKSLDSEGFTGFFRECYTADLKSKEIVRIDAQDFDSDSYNACRALTISGDGSKVAFVPFLFSETGNRWGSVNIWSTDSRAAVQTSVDFSAESTSSFEGALIVGKLDFFGEKYLYYVDGKIHLYDILGGVSYPIGMQANGSLLTFEAAVDDGLSSIDLSQDGKTIALLYRDSGDATLGDGHIYTISGDVPDVIRNVSPGGKKKKKKNKKNGKKKTKKNKKKNKKKQKMNKKNKKKKK